MNVGEGLQISFGAIRSNKMRSGLTLLGVIIGVMTIIAVQSLIRGFQQSINEDLNVLGANVFQVQKFPAIQTGGKQMRKYRNRKNITREQGNAVREHVTAAKAVCMRVYTFGHSVHHQDKKTLPSVLINGATPEFAENYGYYVAQGRFITNADVEHNRSVIVLGVDVLNKLFPYSDPIGQEVKIDANRFEVIGVFEEKGSAFGNSRDNNVVMPISTFEKIWGKRRTVSISIQAKSPELIDLAKEQTIAILRTVRKVPPGQENDFEIFSSESLVQTFDNLTKIARIVAIALASISLVVAGVGIMNIMLVSVTERTREIGIRKAIGAKKNDILWQFLIEAVVLTEVGGVVGIVLGLGIAKFVSVVSPVPAAVPLWTVILGLVFCSVVGIVFGVYPAAKAAKFDPIIALRYE